MVHFFFFMLKPMHLNAWKLFFFLPDISHVSKIPQHISNSNSKRNNKFPMLNILKLINPNH